MTILFASDWSKHQSPIIDYSTKNESFLKVAEVFHRMGVQNCAFHLSLLDQDLVGVDPFSEELSLLQKAKIARECKLNFWYYLREVERIPESGSMKPTMYKANRMNISLYWLFFNHVMTLVTILSCSLLRGASLRSISSTSSLLLAVILFPLGSTDRKSVV